MTPLERMAGMMPANQNDKEITIPEKLKALADMYEKAYDQQTRTMLLLLAHSDYDLQQIQLAATRAMARVAMAYVNTLPEHMARMALEEIFLMTDDTIKRFTAEVSHVPQNS